MKEKLYKKKHKLYTLFTKVILLEKQINSSTIAHLLIYSPSNITYISGHGQRFFFFFFFFFYM